MAYTPQFGVAEYADSTGKEVVRDVSPIVPEVLRRQQGILPHLKQGGSVYNTDFEWFERDWVPFQWVSDTDYTTSGSLTIDAVASSPDATKFVDVGDLFQMVGSTDGTVVPASEVLQVTAITDADTIVFGTRSYGGSSAPAAAITTNGLIWEKLGPVTGEGSSQGANHMRPYGPPKHNYTHIMRFDMMQTNTARAIKLYGVSDFWGTNLRENTEELALQLDRLVVYSRAKASTPNADKRTMAGIYQLMTEFPLGTTNANANLISSGYTAPNEDLFNALCRKVVAKNGQFNNGRALALMSAANYEIVCDIWKDKILIQREDTVRGMQVKTIMTKLGITVDLEWSPQIRNNHLFLLNPTKIELVTLDGRTWNLHKLAERGVDGVEAYTIGEYSIRMWDADKDHAVCNCLTTTS